jgi:hypothetical protein
MYTRSFTVLVWYMYINNNNNKRYHRNRETMDTSDTCIHDRSLYWSGTCTLIIIIKDIIETEKNRYLWHMYTWPFTVLVWYMYINNNNNNKRYHRNRETKGSCIHVSEVLIVSLFLWYVLLLLLLMYMYQTSTVNGHVYMCQRYWLFLCFYDLFYYYYY